MPLLDSPKRIITLGVVFILICIAISTSLAVNTRWLGVELAPHEQGLLITAVHKDSPAAKRLKPGDIITAIKSHEHDAITLQALDIMEDPYDLNLYKEFDNFFERQTAIYDRLKSSSTIFILADNQTATLTAADTRPINALPLLFWFQLACGGASLLISIGVFAFRQDEIAPRCFALSAIGLMVIITAAAMYSTRELAIDGGLFYRLTLANQYGTVLFVALGAAVIWHSPRRLSPLPMASILLALYSLFALLHTLEVWETLNVGIRFPIFLFVIFIVIFSVLSWRNTRGRPASRAALKWLLYAWFSGITLFLGLRLIPVALGFGSLVPQASAWLALLLIYVGIALGLTRYRLFNLDRWVLKAWFWIFSGLAVIGLDLLLATLLDLSSALAIAISLAIIGWIYFPIRQALWGRFTLGPRRIDYETLVPEILEMILTPDPKVDLTEKWQALLRKVFQPLEITPLKNTQKSIEITRNGFALCLPALPGGASLELTGANRADRLFNPNDVRFSRAVWEMFNRAFEFRLAFEQGAEEERQRISRDLHDDVAARLLTLVHRASDTGYEKLARQALGALRDTIYTLGAQSSPPLDDLLADMRYEIQQRLDAIDIKLAWEVTGKPQGITLNPRQHINLQRVAQELISNAIHHAKATKVDIKINIQADKLQLVICDDGIGGDISQWTLGKGINNIINRMRELGGEVNWFDRAEDQQGCCVKLQFPL